MLSRIHCVISHSIVVGHEVKHNAKPEDLLWSQFSVQLLNYDNLKAAHHHFSNGHNVAFTGSSCDVNAIKIDYILLLLK